jgi:aspartate carbamoyltransferase regulatory subunit
VGCALAQVPKNISVFSPNLTLDDIDEEEIARQLTLIEYEVRARAPATVVLKCANLLVCSSMRT